MGVLSTVCLWPARAAAEQAPGALIQVTMRSTVGVVLDEIPIGMRDRIAASYLHMPDTFWQDRAIMQLEHTFYRLVYRFFFYSQPKGPLPLPPALPVGHPTVVLGPGCDERYAGAPAPGRVGKHG
jgi:hypothetical protein